MSQTTITGAGIFNCPKCNEMIYSDAKICRFCSAPVDPEAAALGARLQAQVNNACNQAKLLRHFAVSMWVFFLLSFVLGMAAVAFMGLMIAIPGWLVYWQFTFGKLRTNDPDYETARRDRLIALYLWIPAPIVRVLLFLLGSL